ncbi:UNVERIFIED_CONTAM: hypothetical protein GTU68_032871 [Idotea baltica]|nr:hypothetical protein [Idotea baltica]
MQQKIRSQSTSADS